MSLHSSFVSVLAIRVILYYAIVNEFFRGSSLLSRNFCSSRKLKTFYTPSYDKLYSCRIRRNKRSENNFQKSYNIFRNRVNAYTSSYCTTSNEIIVCNKLTSSFLYVLTMGTRTILYSNTNADIVPQNTTIEWGKLFSFATRAAAVTHTHTRVVHVCEFNNTSFRIKSGVVSTLQS